MFAACLPYPHTTSRFIGVTGRVLDAKTHQPIAGVEVAIRDHPTTATKTNANGAFHLGAEINHRLFIIAAACSPGDGTYWAPVLNISHPNYQPFVFDAYKNLASPSRDGEELRTTDVLLEQK
jgi:hypothetical protein